MNNLIKQFTRSIILFLSIFIVLVCIGIIINLYHSWNKPDTSDESSNTYSQSDLSPTISDQNRNIISEVHNKGTDDTKLDPPTVIPTLIPSSESEETAYYYDLSSLDFIDEINGWVIAWNYYDSVVQYDTKLLHTTDGGMSWETYSGSNILFKKVTFQDSKLGWALALEGHPELSDGVPVTFQILSTEDGGRSWKPQFTCKAVYGESFDLINYIKNKVWAMIGGRIYFSVDGGNSWKETDIPMKDLKVEHIAFIDEMNGWASGVVEAANTSKQSPDSNEISSSGESNYIVYILHTSDGGSTWEIQFTEDYGNEWNGTLGISFADKDNGWLLTCNYGTLDGKLYRTIDGGGKWEKVNQMRVCRPYVMGMEAVTKDILWIPMNHGAGPLDGGLFCSKDAGRNFYATKEELQIYNSTEVDFVTSEYGWAIINGMQENYLMKTEDGGETWNKVITIDY